MRAAQSAAQSAAPAAYAGGHSARYCSDSVATDSDLSEDASTLEAELSAVRCKNAQLSPSLKQRPRFRKSLEMDMDLRGLNREAKGLLFLFLYNFFKIKTRF